jgi:hypothetical protein
MPAMGGAVTISVRSRRLTKTSVDPSTYGVMGTPIIGGLCKERVSAVARVANHAPQPWGTYVKAMKANYIIFSGVFCFESLYCLAFTAFTGPLDMGPPMAGDPWPDQRRC